MESKEPFFFRGSTDVQPEKFGFNLKRPDWSSIEMKMDPS